MATNLIYCVEVCINFPQPSLMEGVEDDLS